MADGCSNKQFSITPTTALPVTFKRDIQRLAVKEGQCAVFGGELSKPGAPVDWRKGRVVLKCGEKYEMKQDGRLIKLVINNVEESDAGKYTCKTKDCQSSAELIVKGECVWECVSSTLIIIIIIFVLFHY